MLGHDRTSEDFSSYAIIERRETVWVKGSMKGNFGFIHEKTDIKILILFILRRLPGSITFDALTELTMCDDGIGYFDYAECVEELLQTEHIWVKDGKYAITAKGIRNGSITENSLPFTVKLQAEKATAAARAAHNRDSMIKTSHYPAPEGGCNVGLTLSDGIGDIVKMELFTANEQQAEALEKGFRDKAENIYHALIEMLLE